MRVRVYLHLGEGGGGRTKGECDRALLWLPMRVRVYLHLGEGGGAHKG